MISIGIAFAFGFFHALEPGHGKTAFLTYIASGKKSWKEGAVLSVTSAFTHTLSILFIAFFVHCFVHHSGMTSEVLNAGHILNIVSGSLIAVLGIWLIIKSNKKQTSISYCSCHHHHHDHQVKKVKMKNKHHYLTSGLLGIAMGMIPCPSLIVVYLTGVSSHHAWSGLQNILLFALGMCVSLMTIVVVFSLCGEKIISKLKRKTIPLNWRLIQGTIFIIIGIVTAFYH